MPKQKQPAKKTKATKSTKTAGKAKTVKTVHKAKSVAKAKSAKTVSRGNLTKSVGKVKSTKPAGKAKRTTKRATKTTTARKSTRAVREPGLEVEEQALAGETILTPEAEQPMMSTGSADTWDYQPDKQVEDVIAESEELDNGGDELAEDLRTHHSESPVLSGGDLDANWADGEESGEESVGGSNPTPDQDRVDELGEAVGIVYQDEEPLHTNDKLEKRDRERWELNPASGDPGQ